MKKVTSFLIMFLFLWTAISWAQEAKLKQKSSDAPVFPTVFQSTDAGQTEINTSTVPFDPWPDQAIYQNNKGGFNPKGPLAMLVDPAGAGGFEIGGPPPTFLTNGWTEVNGTTNMLYVGTTPVPSAGTYCAFSGSSPTTWAGTANLNVNHFYRDVTIPAGETVLTIDFKYKLSVLDLTWDYLRVYVVPVTTTPVAGTLLTSGQLGGNFESALAYTAALVGTDVIPGNTYRVVFSWRSDGVSPHAAVAVDEINISTLTAFPSATASALGGLWNSPASWVGGVVPAYGDIVVPAGSTLVINQTLAYNDITIDGTVQWLTTTNPSSTVNVLQARNITISASGKLLAHGAVANGARVNVRGNFTNNGIANFAAPSALLTFNGSFGTQTLGGSGTFISDNQGRGMIRQLFFNSLAACDISATLPQNLVTGNLVHTAGSLNTNGKLSIDNTAVSFGGLINRSIYTVTVNNMGSGYTSAPTVTFTAAPAGGTTATGVCNFDSYTGTVRSITITNAGNGYQVAPTFTFSGGGGGTGLAAVAALYQNFSTASIAMSQKSAIATITGGLTINSSQGVGSVFATNGGTGYTSAPTVGFALPVSFINLVTAGGSGYTSVPTVGFVGGGGTGAAGTAVVCRGQVVSVHISTAGTGYTSVPAITLTGGGGSGATAEIPVGMLPTATASIDATLGMITGFTVTNPGYGYLLTFPVVTLTGGGGTGAVAASRHGLYDLRYGFYLPAATNGIQYESAVIPANRRINSLYTLSGTGFGTSFTSNITLYALAPLYYTTTPTAGFTGEINMGGNTLTFEHPNYTGYAGTATAYVSNGNITYKLLGSTSSQGKNFPFNSYDVTGAVNNYLLLGSATTVASEGSTITTLTGSHAGAPSGTKMIGTRTLRIQTNGLYGNTPSLRLAWNSVDALVADATFLFITQATATSGPWTIRSAASGTGMIPANGNRTTATSGVGPIITTGNDYFGWNYALPDCPVPLNLTANNIQKTSANLAWSPGGSETAWEYSYGISPYPTPPAGTIYTSTNNLTNGISPLTSATTYQYYVRASCGSGVYSNWAGPYTFTTLCDPSILPFAEGFESAVFPPLCWKNTGWVSSLYGSAHTGTKWAYSNLAGSQLVSPEIAIPAAGGYQLSFWYRAESASYPQDFNVLISTDGTTFTPVMSVVDAINTTYSEAIFKLLDYNAQNIWVRFDGLTGAGGGAYGVCIDDVTVDAIPPPGFIAGIVTDEATGLPIEGAFVSTTPGGFAAISMANGHYAMMVDKGTFSVSCEKADYFTETVPGVVVESSLSTTVNIALTPIPAPYCADLVGPADNATGVLPNTILSWAPGTGTPLVLGYKLQLYNNTTGVWIEGDEFGGTDLGNVTTYTPATPFEGATDYVWLITPYNNAGSPEGCFPWYFSTASVGSIQGLVKDQATGLPIQGAMVFIEQTYPPSAVGTTFTLYSAADGTWNFDWVSGVYKITYSKFTYANKTVTNIAIYPDQTTNQTVLLTPETPYQIPFTERWNAPTTFNTQKWSVLPTAANWSVYATSGNPAPSARFYYGPRIYNYERTLQSFYINGVGKPKIYAQFDLYLQNYSKATLETMTFMVYDGYQWNNVAVFDNQQGINGSIPWTTFTFDISSWAAGKQFLIGFKAAGGDSNNIDWWFVDNIYITTNLMDVAPASITDAIDKTQTSVHNITITNPGISPLSWNATFNVPSPWATLTAMSGVVSAGTTATVPLTFSGNAVPPGVYDAIITFSAAGGVVQKTVAVHLDIYELQVNPMVIFDELNTTETSVWNITLTNPGTLPFTWNAAFDAKPWFSLSETNGVLQGGGQKVLSLTYFGNAVDPGSYEGEIVFTAAGGLIIKTVDLGLNVYDMILDPEAVLDALSMGGTVTHQVQISNPYTGNLAWTASVPALPWLSMTPVAGTIPAGGSVTVDITFDAAGVPAGIYRSQIVIDGAGGNVVKELPVGVNIYDEPFQKVNIPVARSWGYISSYMALNGKMPLEEALASILNEMVIMVGEDGIFWPSQNINTIGEWNPYQGYKLKMTKVGLLCYVGGEVTNKVLNFTAGVHLVPVLSNTSVPLTDLFAGKPIEFAFGLDGSIWWPAGNIFTLNSFDPGYAYLVKFTAATTLNFNVKGVAKPNTPDVYVNKTSWNDVFRTGDVHIVGVSPEACADLLPGDVIGVFNSEGLCTAMAEYRADKKSFAFSVFADDQTTMEIDGMTDSQLMTLKLYRDNMALDLYPVYNQKMPNYDGLFAINGLSQISGFKVGSVGIGENELSSISVYPNPTSGIFNITLKGIDAQLRVVIVNSQGQEIYTSALNASSQIDLTSQPRGVYFVKIIGNDVLKTEKLIVK